MRQCSLTLGQNGPEFCQKNDRSNGGFCDDDEICTANRNCWDGEMERTRDIPRFTGDSIADQGESQLMPHRVDDKYHCTCSYSFRRYSHMTLHVTDFYSRVKHVTLWV